MSGATNSTRRGILKFGALFGVPIAAPAVAAAALDKGAASHDAETAIRELHRRWLRGPDAAALGRSVRAIRADHEGEAPTIELAADGSRAEALFPCVVELETELPQGDTLLQMAHAQGNAAFRSTEKRMVRGRYVRAENGWRIDAVELV